MNEKEVIKIVVPSKANYLSLIRLTVSSIAAEMNFDVEEIDDIKVSVGEACNSIIEVNEKKKSDNIKIKFKLYEDKLSIVIGSVKKIEFGKLNSNLMNEDNVDLFEVLKGGLGLTIIESLMDEVNIEKIDKKGTEIKMTKFKKGE